MTEQQAAVVRLHRGVLTARARLTSLNGCRSFEYAWLQPLQPERRQQIVDALYSWALALDELGAVLGSRVLVADVPGAPEPLRAPLRDYRGHTGELGRCLAFLNASRAGADRLDGWGLPDWKTGAWRLITSAGMLPHRQRGDT